MPKKAKDRVFHLSAAEVDAKVQRLQTKLAALPGKENASRRKNIGNLVRKLAKAREKSGDVPSTADRRARISSDKLRRTAKKLAKRQEKSEDLRRLKNKQRKLNCLLCKKYGHVLAECPEKASAKIQSSICYNCGLSGHGLTTCPKPVGDATFAVCFVCKTTGHVFLKVGEKLS